MYLHEGADIYIFGLLVFCSYKVAVIRRVVNAWYIGLG